MARRGKRRDGVGAEDRTDTRTTTEVAASLIVNVQALLAKEVELLGIELRGIVTRKLAAVALLLTNALLAAGVLGFAAVTLAVALEDVLATRWHAWGLVTLGLLVISVIVLTVAGRLLSGPWSPRRTRAQLDRTGAWLADLAAEQQDSARAMTQPTQEDDR